MPVTEQTPINTSTTNGVTTVFPYGFKIAQTSDLQVLLDNVAVTTGFTVSGVGNDSGGDVTFAVPPGAGKQLVRKRNMKYARSTDYQENGDLLSQTLDDDQDAPVMMIQQIAEALSRAFLLPPGSSAPVFPPLLDPLKYWRNRADGLGVEFVDLSSGDSSIALAAALADPSDTKGATLVAFGPDTVAASLAASCRMFATVAALRTNGNARITAAGTFGYSAANDGGGAPYYKDAADNTTADDGFLCIVDAGGRRWKLNRKIDEIDPRHAGVTLDNVDSSTAWAKVLAFAATLTSGGAGVTIKQPVGVMKVANFTIPARVKIRGAGSRSSIINVTGTGDLVTISGVTNAGISGVRIGMPSSATAVALRVTTTTGNSVRWIDVDDIEIAGANVSGQVGLALIAAGSDILSDSAFNRIKTFQVDQPIQISGAEGNDIQDFEINDFAVSVARAAISSVGHANRLSGRVAASAATAGSTGYTEGGTNNIVDISVDIGAGGNTALNISVNDAGNVIRVTRPEFLTPIGAYARGNTITDSQFTVAKRTLTKGASPSPANFALSAGWGTGASVTVNGGTDQRVDFTVTAGSASFAANPTVSFTFADGAFPFAPMPQVTRNGGNQLSVNGVLASSTTSSSGFTWVGTPAVGETYRFVLDNR